LRSELETKDKTVETLKEQVEKSRIATLEHDSVVKDLEQV
jgi:hypothetical protein